MAWLALTGLLVVLVMALDQRWGIAGAAAVAVVWLGQLWWIRRRFGYGSGVSLALLAHLLLLGYVVGVAGVVFLLVRGLLTHNALLVVLHAALTLPFAALVWACRRSERMIGERCIRRHLIDLARPGTISGP